MATITLVVALLVAPAVQASAPVVYSIPAPEHHWAQVEVTFTALPPARLEARMSRSSPGRYALHEFAKNVFDVRAHDGGGRQLRYTRPSPYQ